MSTRVERRSRRSEAVTPDRSSQLLHDPVDIQELSIDRTSQRTHPVNPSERRPPIDQSTVDPSGRSSRRDFIIRIPRSQVDERGPSSSSARTDHHVPEQTPPPLRHGDRIPRSQYVNMTGVMDGDSWCDLPTDILNEIAKCFLYVEQIQFRSVCKNWRSNTNPVKHVADKLPWVMSFTDNYGAGWFNGGSFFLYDPSQK
ncbi:hypothetical protein LWI29_025172 [Acer saccharum]|uniref:F-box domain-containing protein n=1 Tax=Acer saccharum TaxID=4024 RepID=A0AA39W570_ACESA|nr:hypothetical protein LWI29_025172 [Acer saccharum]